MPNKPQLFLIRTFPLLLLKLSEIATDKTCCVHLTASGPFPGGVLSLIVGTPKLVIARRAVTKFVLLPINILLWTCS
jgi:hypothetical protein